VGDTLRIADVVAPGGATLLDDPETVVATITAPTREIEPEPVEGEEGEEAAEGEEVAEGEAATEEGEQPSEEAPAEE